MSKILAKISTDTWIIATWDEYLQETENSDYNKAKFYYHNGKLRIEMSPLGNDHASDHSIINHAIHLYAALNNIELNGKDNCTYQRIGSKSAQPDLSFYIGQTANAVPYGTSIIELNKYPPPTLVIEIANTSFGDDLGAKRFLYEDLEVREYWIVDVKNVKIIAFKVEQEGSRRIQKSVVLPDLEIALLEEALRRTRQSNHSRVSAWLLEQFQKK